ncbi:MBL fold metallo-hydrolase [Ideonella sp. BN130291]|uniref:MBL fold metallo-hydrolase n=1 Tax=Ideonella sp. BN130291 TaxID=3112940 RepID=UPI002E2543A8|nr:MBL fold metallo-hydrolase [Ideonella sp. BN130291]
MANPNESALHYPLGDQLPDTGTTLELAPGVRWVRMALPFALDHINLWLLRDTLDGREGWSIVDCGITSDATRAAWEQVFAHELQGLPVLRVIVTHMHPDHIGLAHWLCERWSTEEHRPAAEPPQGGPSPLGGQRSGAAASLGAHTCRLWISTTDFNAARMASQSTTGFGGDDAAQFFASHGLTNPESLQKVRARSNYYAGMVPQVPRQFRRLLDGQTVRIGGRDWLCISGYGHAPEHIALYCAQLKVLISGDMLLPRISTNVSVYDLEPEADPLPLYLSSIARFTALPQDTLVLPSHGKPFTGLHERVRQLVQHHDERFAEVLQACAEAPQSAADMLPVLFKRPLDLHQTTFAMGESIAHLHALWMRGQLRRERGADGVYRFAAVADAAR